MRKTYPITLLMGAMLTSALFILACSSGRSLIVDFNAQNTIPHSNAVSLQPGTVDGKYFDVVIHLGMRDREDRTVYPPSSARLLNPLATVEKTTRRVMKDVTRLSCLLEYWGAIVDFRLQWEPGGFFETKAGENNVQYSIGAAYIADNGLTILPIDVSIDNQFGDPTDESPQKGDVIVLKFRGIRSGKIPIAFAGRFGSLYNSQGQRLTGIGWYGAVVSNTLQ